MALIIRQAKKFDESIYKKIPKIKEVTDIIDNFDDYRKKAMIDSLQKLGLSNVWAKRRIECQRNPGRGS